LFHDSNIFGSCFFHILYTGCDKIKKNNSGAKRLKETKNGLEGVKIFSFNLIEIRERNPKRSNDKQIWLQQMHKALQQNLILFVCRLIRIFRTPVD